jgi:hypothetical protein
VLDTTDGRPVSITALSGDVDDIFFDEKANRIYAACGEGRIDVLSADEDGACYTRIARVESAPGARTCLFDPKTRRLYVAAPKRGAAAAAILVFRPR